MLKNGDAVIAINSGSVLSTDHPLRIDTGQRAGLGVEIVLKVADVEGAYRAILVNSPGGCVTFASSIPTATLSE